MMLSLISPPGGALEPCDGFLAHSIVLVLGLNRLVVPIMERSTVSGPRFGVQYGCIYRNKELPSIL